MSEQANESGENVSEIQRLTARIHDLGASRDSWNNAYMILVALTVILAAGVFIAQFVISRKETLLSEAQDALIKEKDRIARADSNLKDEKIADALRQAGESNKAAALANERAGKAEERAAEANRVAEGEKLARIKIEERMAGWRLDVDSKRKLVEKLASFSGTPFDLVTDTLETRFMNEIDDALIVSGWVRLPARQPDGQPYSVIIGGKAGVYVGVPGIHIEIARDSFDRLGGALSALANGLVAVGIPAKTNIVRAGEGDARSVHIVIGKRE